MIDEVEAFEAQHLKNTAKKEMEEFAVERLKKTERRMVLKDLKSIQTIQTGMDNLGLDRTETDRDRPILDRVESNR